MSFYPLMCLLHKHLNSKIYDVHYKFSPYFVSNNTNKKSLHFEHNHEIGTVCQYYSHFTSVYYIVRASMKYIY